MLLRDVGNLAAYVGHFAPELLDDCFEHIENPVDLNSFM